MQFRIGHTLSKSQFSFDNSLSMDELRERRIRKQEEPKTFHSLPKMVKQFDLFPKVDDDYVIQTKQGGYGIIFDIGRYNN